MKVSCLICKEALDSFHVFPKKALFTKPMKNPRPDAIADMGIAYCPSCRHISSHLSTSFSMEEMSRITYAELYDTYAPTDLSPSQKSYSDFVAAWLTLQFTKGSSILEIGSHDGYLLHSLGKAGYTCEGVEPSPFADVARERYGVKVRKDFFRPEHYAPESFDVVIFRHVVEHLHDPEVLLRESLSVLKPGGLLYVEVPNSLGSVQDRFFPEFHADHVSYFTIPSMVTLLGRIGITDILHQESFSAYMKFPFLAALGRKGGRPATAKPLGGWFLDFKIQKTIADFVGTYDRYQTNLKSLYQGTPLIVWGTGSIGIQYAIDAGWSHDQARYVDINPKNHGLRLSVTGHLVESPEIIRAARTSCVVVASGWEEDARRQLAPFLSPGTSVIGYSDLLR